MGAMSNKSVSYLVVNFGGPRTLDEVEPFLCELLLDQDVIWPKMPTVMHNILFRRIAKKRSLKAKKEYLSIGGKSPIYEDTESVASELQKKLHAQVFTFHRYLPATHQDSLCRIENIESDEIHVFPMFPQFTYATTGSVARFFCKHLTLKTLCKLRWVKSYANHSAFIQLTCKSIQSFLNQHQISEDETFFLFSAHGLPKYCIEYGDPYQHECCDSYRQVMKFFPRTSGILAYQSRFGPDEWIGPYTVDVCNAIETHARHKRNVLFIPISFTSDHIETLFEIETEYMTRVARAGIKPHRLPAFNRQSLWIDTIIQILASTDFATSEMLVRR